MGRAGWGRGARRRRSAAAASVAVATGVLVATSACTTAGDLRADFTAIDEATPGVASVEVDTAAYAYSAAARATVTLEAGASDEQVDAVLDRASRFVSDEGAWDDAFLDWEAVYVLRDDVAVQVPPTADDARALWAAAEQAADDDRVVLVELVERSRDDDPGARGTHVVVAGAADVDDVLAGLVALRGAVPSLASADVPVTVASSDGMLVVGDDDSLLRDGPDASRPWPGEEPERVDVEQGLSDLRLLQGAADPVAASSIAAARTTIDVAGVHVRLAPVPPAVDGTPEPVDGTPEPVDEVAVDAAATVLARSLLGAADAVTTPVTVEGATEQHRAGTASAGAEVVLDAVRPLVDGASVGADSLELVVPAGGVEPVLATLGADPVTDRLDALGLQLDGQGARLRVPGDGLADLGPALDAVETAGEEHGPLELDLVAGSARLDVLPVDQGFVPVFLGLLDGLPDGSDVTLQGRADDGVADIVRFSTGGRAEVSCRAEEEKDLVSDLCRAARDRPGR